MWRAWEQRLILDPSFPQPLILGESQDTPYRLDGWLFLPKLEGLAHISLMCMGMLVYVHMTYFVRILHAPNASNYGQITAHCIDFNEK